MEISPSSVPPTEPLRSHGSGCAGLLRSCSGPTPCRASGRCHSKPLPGAGRGDGARATAVLTAGLVAHMLGLAQPLCPLVPGTQTESLKLSDNLFPSDSIRRGEEKSPETQGFRVQDWFFCI